MSVRAFVLVCVGVSVCECVGAWMGVRAFVLVCVGVCECVCWCSDGYAYASVGMCWCV